MRVPAKAIAACLTAAALGQQAARFQPLPASSYAARQTAEMVTIAAEPFDDKDRTRLAFGKANPAKFGITPILLVIANDSDRVLQLEGMRVQLITADRQKVEPVPAEDVERPQVRRPDLVPPTIPGIPAGKKKRKEGNVLQYEARQFVERMVPAKTSAHGFFYFRTAGQTRSAGSNQAIRLAGSQVYITGLREAATGRDLFYFEINLDDYLKTR